MQTSYAVINKTTGQLFAGFDPEHNVLWTDDESSARTYNDKRDARGQALLFVAHLIPVQQKPVVL